MRLTGTVVSWLTEIEKGGENMNLLLCMMSALAFFAAETGSSTAVTADTIKPLIDSITSQLTPASIISILSLVIAAAVGFVFLWWGIRKVAGVIITAFKKGKLKV